MKKLHLILGALGAVALAAPGAAAAQDTYEPYDEPRTDTETRAGEDARTSADADSDTYVVVEDEGEAIAESRQDRGAKDRGVEVQAQGGGLFFPGEAASQLSPGAAYGVVVGIEPGIPVLELELGYQGAAYQTDERLTGAQENAIENGGQALLKASPLAGAWEPYVFGGYQLSRFNVYERDNSTGALEDDTINKAPVGAGVDIHLGDVLVGARGQYNFVFDQDAFTNIDDARSADQLGATLLIGGQF